MEVISIERSTYEELLTSFNNFVTQMKAKGSRFGNLTPSAFLLILRYPHFRTSSFFPILPLF